MYEGPEGTLFGQWEDGRFFIHSILTEPEKLSQIKKCKMVLQALEDNLKARGFDRYYTMADSVNSFRFNQLMGFETNNELWNDVLEVMVKEI